MLPWLKYSWDNLIWNLFQKSAGINTNSVIFTVPPSDLEHSSGNYHL